MGTGKFNAGGPGGQRNLAMDWHPIHGEVEHDTPDRFVLLKLEIGASRLGHLARMET